MRAGDVVRNVKTREVVRITTVRGGGPRYWEPASRWQQFWGDNPIRVLECWPLFVRGTRNP